MYRFDPYAEPMSLGFLQFLNEYPVEERSWPTIPRPRMLDVLPPKWDLWECLHPAEWHILAIKRIRDLSQTVVQHVGQAAPGFSQRNPHEWVLLAAPINRDYGYFLFPHGICLVADERVRVRSEDRLRLLEDRALIEPQPFSVPHLGEDVPKAIWESYRCAMRELEPPRLPLRGA
ncbi:hypothetical protein HYW67_00985 [Candidatus Parcubacteria bacterium]|nr:hypothetical protein [Candidatus Parcubacteria bacterium]